MRHPDLQQILLVMGFQGTWGSNPIPPQMSVSFMQLIPALTLRGPPGCKAGLFLSSAGGNLGKLEKERKGNKKEKKKEKKRRQKTKRKEKEKGREEKRKKEDTMKH